MEKKLTVIISLFCLLVIPGINAAEFNGLEYNLQYTNLSGNLDLFFDINGNITDLEFQFDVAENMPSTVIPDYIDNICDSTSPDYNEQLCLALSQLFTPEVLAWLDAQWNQHMADALMVFPQSIETRQLPWPVDYFGSIYLVDYQLDWPCSWDSDEGSFENIPLNYSFDTPIGQDMMLTTSFGLQGEGLIDRNAAYGLNGGFVFDSGIAFTGTNINIDIQFSLDADFQGIE